MNVSTQALHSAVSQFAFLFGDTISVNGATLPCIPSDAAKGQRWETEGGWAELDLTLYVSRAVLATPEVEGVLIYHGTTYHIKRVSEDADKVGWRLDCMAEF